MSRGRPAAPSPATVPIAFVNGMLAGVSARGEDVAVYLQDAGIAPPLLRQPAARITATQYAALFRSLTERRDDDFMGFLSRPLRRGSLALMARAAISARTLDVAMRRAAHTLGLLQDDVRLEAVAEGAMAGWSLRLTDPAVPRPNFLHELLLRVFWRLLAWLAGGRLPASRFDFAFPIPPYAGGYGAIFPALLRFGCERSAFWFDAAQLRNPVRRDERALQAFLANAQENVIVPRRGGDAISARVRAHLQQTQPEWPGLAACAQALHLSAATLQRHLAQDGTTFQALKDELRRDLAIHRLNTSPVPLSVLAGELGFADSASFQRAFKSWTGSAPGPYRRAGA